jgi:hypothetical protein
VSDAAVTRPGALRRLRIAFGFSGAAKTAAVVAYRFHASLPDISNVLNAQ